MGRRFSSGYQSLVAALTSVQLWAVSDNRRAVVKKILWRNRTAGNEDLRIGYIDVVAGAFQQTLPDIQMIAGIDDVIEEVNLPIMGNGPEGFSADASVAAGSTGTIVAQSTGAGADPADIQVCIEVEEI